MRVTNRTVLACLVLLAFAAAAPAADPAMRAHFIDVGQGDATLLEFPCGAILIDAGAQDQEHVTKLVAYLEQNLTSAEETVHKLAFEILGHAGSERDFPHAVRLLEPRLRGTDSVRRLLAARALGRIAPADRVGGVVRTQGYLENWMVLGTFLNDGSNSGFDEPYPPETGIDFEAKYTARYVWTLEGNRKDKEQA